MATTITKLSTDDANTTSRTAARTAGTTANATAAAVAVATTNTNIVNNYEQSGFCHCRLCSLQVHQSHDGMMIRLQPCGCLFCKDCMIQSLAYTIVKIVNGKQSAKALDCFHCHQLVTGHNGERFQPLAAATTKKTLLRFHYNFNQEGSVSGASNALPSTRTNVQDSAPQEANFELAWTAVAKPTELATPTPKRKRGRPRKDNIPATTTVDKVAANVNAVDPISDSVTPNAKRKRARSPSKRVPPPRAEVEDETNLKSVDAVTPTAKRQRVGSQTNIPPSTTTMETNQQTSPEEAPEAIKERKKKEKEEKERKEKEERFEENYKKFVEQLQTFKDQHGHCRVPTGPASKEPHHLKKWVASLRNGRITLSTERFRQLNQIGFVWETNLNRFERLFQDKLAKLKIYKATYGDCLVPRDWKEDVQLAEWTHKQRQLLSRGKLQPHRKKILDDVGFVWKPFEVRRKKKYHDDVDSSNSGDEYAAASSSKDKEHDRYDEESTVSDVQHHNGDHGLLLLNRQTAV